MPDATTLTAIDAGAMATLAALATPILDLLTALALITILMLGIKAAVSEDAAVFQSVFELIISVAIIQGIVRGMPLIWDALRQFGEVIAGQALGDTLITPQAVFDILVATLALMMEQISGLGGWMAIIASLHLVLFVFLVMVIIIAAYAFVFYVLASAYIRLGWSAVATVAMSWMSIVPQLRFATKNGLASMISAATQIILVSLMTSVLFNAVEQAAVARGELTFDLVIAWATAAGFTLLGALVGKEIADAIARGGPEMGSTLITQAGAKAKGSAANSKAAAGGAWGGAKTAGARMAGGAQALKAALGARR